MRPDHAYPEKDFFGHDPLHGEPVWPLECPVFPQVFRDDRLNLAASYIRNYLQLQDTHDWIHAMVKVVAFDSFLQAMDSDNGITRTLQFFCWCDGGKYEEARYRQHRHSIVVSPKGHFQTKVWPKVKVARENKPCHNFPCKRLKMIQSPLHLMNAIGYLSHRKSRCQFSFIKESESEADRQFYLHLTLPAEFKLQLVLAWEHGLYQLLYMEKIQNVSLARAARNPMILDNGQYKQNIEYLPEVEWNLVLPVRKCLAPTWEPTEHVMHLMNGRKLYFRYDPEYEGMDDRLWLLKQAENGNCFYNNVKEEMWTPRRRDQAILNYHMPVVDRIGKLEAENTDLKRKGEETEAYLKKKCELKQDTINKLQTEIKELNATFTTNP